MERKEKTKRTREFDIVVFGSSGFVGKYIVAEMIRAAEENPSIVWAVAGRSQKKLWDSLEEVVRYYDVIHEFSSVPTIIADANDEKSLSQMTSRTRVLINCVGPYSFYGEKVVASCMATQTDHVDISGEQLYLEATMLKFDRTAKDAGVYVIGSCGFESIPSDLGVVFIAKQFNGDLNTVEGYVKVLSAVPGAMIHYGTFAAAVNSYRNRIKINEQNKLIFREAIPIYNYGFPERKRMFFSYEVNSWCHPFPRCDKSVVNRSQYVFYKDLRRRPIRYKCYYSCRSVLDGIFTVIALFILRILCSFRITRWIALLFPNVFTAGVVSRRGPRRAKVDGASFTFTLVGNGYSQKIDNPIVTHREPPDSRIVVRITGPDMAYLTTSICVVQSALLVVQERDRLPQGGGVFTPATAFHETSLIDRLGRRGIAFSILKPQYSVP